MSRTPYDGLSRKLILAIDVGTTFSGVSYCILEPGQIPEIRGVNRYPGQEHIGGDLKIPTVLWYDAEGNVMAVGAEATRAGIEVEAEDDQWVKAEWFKVYLRPEGTEGVDDSQIVPPLPPNKTVVQVFADFMRYIFSCSKTYIQDTYHNGKVLWESVEDTIQFVLTHPNGYEGHQQDLMREAAVLGGLVPDDKAAESRISLLTEGEASLHYCIQCGFTTDCMKDGKGVMIVDAGGGTLDFSSYIQKDDDFMEISASQCVYNGSVYVTTRARTFFQKLLKGTRFEDDLDIISDTFDKKTKPSFRSEEDNYWVPFAGAREKAPELNIKSGQLRVQGSDIASFFEPSIDAIVTTVDQQTFALEGTTISSVFLVGGFAASDYLFLNMKDRLTSYDINVSRPESHLNKAVAHGAVSYCLDNRVKARVSKYTYGVPCSIQYQPTHEEHVKRKSKKYEAASGASYIPGSFDIILKKDTQVAETKEFRRPFARIRDTIDQLRTMKTTIKCYRGNATNPEWFDNEQDKYTTMCTIEADLSELCDTLQPRISIDKEGVEKTFYRSDFEIALLFGLTEFKAVVIWKDQKGVEHQSRPAKVKFNPDDAE